MEKYCRFLLIVKQRIKSFKKQWVDTCKKNHHTPRPNNNQKSTLVMTENTPPIVADLAKTRLVKTTDHKYASVLIPGSFPFNLSPVSMGPPAHYK